MITPEQNQRINDILRYIHLKVLADKELSKLESEAWQLRAKRGQYYAVREHEQLFINLINEYDSNESDK